jgi:uncharacterized membrane protein
MYAIFWCTVLIVLLVMMLMNLHAFRDNCAEQNKNHALLRMIMILVEIKKLKKVFSTKRTLVFVM